MRRAVKGRELFNAKGAKSTKVEKGFRGRKSNPVVGM